MIKFKVLKYKHQKEAQDINRRIEDGTVEDDEILKFVVSLVDSWDFKDEETGKPLKFDDYLELSLEQYKDLMHSFNRRMGGDEVPKLKSEQ